MPHIFAKYHNSVTGHGKPIIYPKIVKQLDLEGELTAVIGKTAYYVEEKDALVTSAKQLQATTSTTKAPSGMPKRARSPR